MFYHHLINLPENSLAYEIAATQTAMSFPGLMMECAKLMENYEITDAKSYTKIQWKKIVKKKVTDKNRESLLEIVKKKY